VAELVRKYQDFLPAQGVQDLAKTALSPRPIVSESEQEYTLPVQRRTTVRTKTRHQIPRKSSVSDFEQSYAANIAHLNRPRRIPVAGNSSRIPGPVASAGDSHTSSRRTSPDKRFITAKTRNTRPGRPSSPLGSQGTTKRANNRVASQSKDKSPRVSSNMGNKSGIWKPPASGVKVSTMTRHFERLSKDAERSKTRYSVIRGKRARPVTSAHARVVILPSVQDAIKDETDVSDASSEADDEADANEEDAREPLQPAITDNADFVASTTTTEDAAPPEPSVQPETETVVDANLAKQPPGPVQPPPSPLLDSGKQKHENLTSDLETLPIGTERGSFFRALSGLLLQQPLTVKQTIEIDDPMNDPEYIYNDSSMIVRTDEPTSIVALALE
jgi:1-phosphatidylinositol-3-phosphate 5-kinase